LAQASLNKWPDPGIPSIKSIKLPTNIHAGRDEAMNGVWGRWKCLVIN